MSPRHQDEKALLDGLAKWVAWFRFHNGYYPSRILVDWQVIWVATRARGRLDIWQHGDHYVVFGIPLGVRGQ